MSDFFEDMIRSGLLYVQSFVKEFGEAEPHWFNSSWKEREASLRHDYVCCLLCNEEVTDTRKRKGEVLESSKVKQRKPNLCTPSTSSSSGSSGSLGSNKEYRLIMLEGNPTAPMIQAQYEREWGAPKCNKIWDVVDLEESKFIEVKVSSLYEKHKQDYLEGTSGMGDHFALCVANPIDGSVKWVNHRGGLQGELKVSNFLLQRVAYMSERNVTESRLDSVLDLGREIFSCNWFNSNVREWVEGIWSLRGLTEPPNYTFNQPGEEGASLIDVTPSRLLEKLEDPKMRNTEFVKWKGKILPEPMVANIITGNYEDSKMVGEFMENLKDDLNLGCYYNLWKERENCYEYLLREDLDKTEYEWITKNIGWKMKRRRYDPCDKGTRMPEAKTRERLRYHPWFDHLMSELIEPHT